MTVPVQPSETDKLKKQVETLTQEKKVLETRHSVARKMANDVFNNIIETQSQIQLFQLQQQEMQKTIFDKDAEIKKLTAELAKYTTPAVEPVTPPANTDVPPTTEDTTDANNTSTV